MAAYSFLLPGQVAAMAAYPLSPCLIHISDRLSSNNSSPILYSSKPSITNRCSILPKLYFESATVGFTSPFNRHFRDLKEFATSSSFGQGEACVDKPGEDGCALAVEKPHRKPNIKLGSIMGILNKRAIEAVLKERAVPDLRSGDIVEIKMEIPENKKRLAIYKGIIISKKNSGFHSTIRVRRVLAGVGVEIIFPIYSPIVKEIKVVSHRKVRRAKLYYLRDKLPRFCTFK